MSRRRFERIVNARLPAFPLHPRLASRPAWMARPVHAARPRRRNDRVRPAYAACRVGSVIELWRDTRAGASSGK
jgi:hypothetical protein